MTEPTSTDQLHANKVIYTFCRYFAALLLLSYGFAKINGSQFTVVEWVQDEPLHNVPGFWLVWYYMSYSTVYAMIVAITQVVGGVMLMFRKTTLAGSIILLFVMSNIVMINIFFQIQLGAFIVSLLISFSLVVILLHHYKELKELFWSHQNSVFPEFSENKVVHLVKWGIRSCIVIIPFIFTYWIANYNNINPTPVDGVWEVTEATGDFDSTAIPDRIYFERERAHMAVFRFGESVRRHHFQVTEDTHQIDIWEQWLRRGDKILSGSYVLEEESLTISGILNTDNEPVQLTLTRVR